MPVTSVPQGLWLPPRVATLFVAASDALDRSRAQADFLCDSVADDEQINEALNALPMDGGRVVLSEGTFTLDNPVEIFRHNTTLIGQGRSSFINGNGLATGEHAIVISAITHCTVRNISIRTETGGGKTCHCVFIEDGANDFKLDGVMIIGSDSDGIHIEGTTMLMGHIHNCHIDQADNEGIQVNPGAGNFMYRLHIVDTTITGTGNNGIYIGGRCHYSLIHGNVIYVCGLEGISMLGSSHITLNDNTLFQNTQNGIYVATSNHVTMNNNICYNNTQHGILLNNADECLLEGNICTLNDRADTSTYNGISINNTSMDNALTGNHCCENHNYGIACYGARNSLVGNFCHQNDQHGIYIAAAECSINANYVYHNGVDAADTYHGIYLLVGADRCAVNNNYIVDDGSLTEDGICLADGAIDCQICDNYIYNLRGSGVMLTANNLDCLIKGNYCELNDDYGIEIAAATCSKNIVEGNKLKGNVTGNLLDSGVLTTVEESNKEITPPQVKRYVYMKNTSAAQRVAGDVVIFKSAVAAGDEFTTTVTLGDDHVLGIVAETIAIDAYGYVQVAGKTTVLKGSNDNGAITVGDFLCASDTAVEAVKAGALDTAFAIALEAYDSPEPEPLDALLINPMTF